MKYDIVSIGGSTEDVMFYTKDAVLVKNKKDILRQQLLGFEFGAKITGEKVLFTYGGGGSNTAVNFSRLGLKTGIITTVGDDDNGRRILKNLDAHEVDTRHALKIIKAPSGFSFIVNFSGTTEHVVFTYRSANNFLSLNARSLNSAAADWYYLTSLSGSDWRKSIETLFNQVKGKSKIAWNPGNGQLADGYRGLKKYLKFTEILILNKDEAIELVMSFGKKTDNTAELLKYLIGFGPKIAAITESSRGATVCSKDTICYEKALPIKGINTTGAGDAFGSSLTAGLIIYNDLAKALKMAIVQSNYVIRKIGAQNGLLTLRELKKII